MQISAPDSYVYSITDGSKTPYTHTDAQGNSYMHQQFTHIKAKVKNTTPKEKDVNGNPLTFEEMKTGTLVAVARYKIIPDYEADLSNAPPDGAVMSHTDYSYSVSHPIPIPSLSSTGPAEFTFDFTGSPIPAGITDLSFYVIFKGTLGSEADIAVAVGMKDLIEPTHHVFWNLTDMFSLTVDQYTSPYHLYTSEQIKATPGLAGVVDYDHDGIFNELDKGEPYIDPYELTYEIGYAGVLPSRTTVLPSANITIPPGRHVRLLVLVDRKQPNYIRLTWTQTIQPGTALMYATFQGAVNQTNANAWTATPPNAFRYWQTPEGTQAPIRQHFFAGILRCEPLGIDAAGNRVCPYPEPEAIPAEMTPYPVTNLLFP